MIESSLDVKPEAATLTLTGDLSFDTVRPVRHAILELLQAEGPRLVVDMSRIESFDLSGVQLLISARRSSVSADRRLDMVLGELQPRIQRLLSFAGLALEDLLGAD